MTGLPAVDSFSTARTARIAHLGPRSAPSLWICLHGYRQLAPWFLRHFRVLDTGSRRLVAPEALNRFYVGDPDGRHGPDARVGATWMTREDRENEIADYTRYLDGVLDAETGSGTAADGSSRRPVVLGFSQGAHTAARWTTASRSEMRAVILWGEGLPHDLAETELRRAAGRWILVRGESDPARDSEREARDAELLDAAGAEWEVRLHPGGHRLHGPLLLDLARDLEA